MCPPSKALGVARQNLVHDKPDIALIASIIKDCEEAESIAGKVLDRPNMLSICLEKTRFPHKKCRKMVDRSCADLRYKILGGSIGLTEIDMTKANLRLPNGTVIEIDGSLEDIQAIADHVGRAQQLVNVPAKQGARSRAPKSGAAELDDKPDIALIASIIKDCEEAESIAGKVLDRPDMLLRVLMCLWAVNKYVDPNIGLTSGEISKITDQLGVRISTPNASACLARRANAYVSGDSVRKKGASVRYKINRRGVKVFEEEIA